MIAEVKVQIQESDRKTAQSQDYWDKDRVYSFDEYFELEEHAPFKSEFRNGKVIAMPNGTNEHGLIIGSLHFYLKLAIRSLQAKALVCNSEIKVFITAINEGLHPDVSIVIGERANYKKNKAITNPTIIFEVLSEGTQGYDRGEKFRKYKHLPSFREYVLIEQDQAVVDVFQRLDGGIWQMTSFIGLEATMSLNTLDIHIKLSDIYEDVPNVQLPQYKMDID